MVIVAPVAVVLLLWVVVVVVVVEEPYRYTRSVCLVGSDELGAKS